MEARRRPRLFRDHKAPLVAFVLVVVTSVALLTHMVRSEAARGWVRQGVVAAGGAVRELLDRPPVENRPAPDVERPAAPATGAPASTTADPRPPDRPGRAPGQDGSRPRPGPPSGAHHPGPPTHAPGRPPHAHAPGRPPHAGPPSHAHGPHGQGPHGQGPHGRGPDGQGPPGQDRAPGRR